MREYATRAELQSIADQTTDRTAYLRLAETLTAFLARLRSSAETLDIIERQRVVRLLVKEILVSDDRIVIRHSIPLPTGPSGSHDPSPIGGYPSSASGKSYLLRSGSENPALRRSCCPRHDTAVLHLHRSLQPALDVEQHPPTVRMMPDRLKQPLPIDAVEIGLYVDIEHPVIPPAALTSLAHGIDRRSTGPVAVCVGVKHSFQIRLQVPTGDLLSDAIGDRRNAQRARATVCLRNIDPRTGGGK